MLNALVAFKRNRRKRQVEMQPAEHAYARTPLSSSVLKTRARHHFFRTIYFVDEYKQWAWRAARAGVKAARTRRIDVVLASGPPHSALVAGAYVGRALQVPFVADLRDPWSDYLDWQAAERAPERDFLRRVLLGLERRVLRRAAVVTSTGETVATLLVRRDNSLEGKVRVIRNGFDGEPRVGERATQGRLNILFAGELYVGRDPFPFLAALERLLARSDVDASRIEVVFMGRVDTYEGQSLRQWLKGTRCEQVVTIVPPQPAETVLAAAAKATVLLNLAQGQSLSVPAKTFEHLASGRENLLVCEDDCETARLVVGIKGVNQVDPADSTAFSKVLLDLYERHVDHGVLTSPNSSELDAYSRENANRAFLSVLTSVI